MATEILTTTDKAKRDQMFHDLRHSDNPNERQVVKFSGVQPILNGHGEHLVMFAQYSKNGRVQPRYQYESTWSVAYPAGGSND